MRFWGRFKELLTLPIIIPMFACSIAGTDTDNPALKISPNLPGEKKVSVKFISPAYAPAVSEEGLVSDIYICASHIFLQKQDQPPPESRKALLAGSIELPRTIHHLLPNEDTSFGEGLLDPDDYVSATLWFDAESNKDPAECTTFGVSVKNEFGTFQSSPMSAADNVEYSVVMADAFKVIENKPSQEGFLNISPWLGIVAEVKSVSELDNALAHFEGHLDPLPAAAIVD